MNISLDNFMINIYDLEGYLVAYIVLFAISAIVGIVGNLLILCIIVFTKSLRKMRYAFIFNMSAADLMVSVVTMPMSILGVLVGKHWFEANASICVFSAVVCAPGCVATTYSICAISISRYFYICRYAEYLKYFTNCRTMFYLAVIWVISFAAHLPNHVGWGVVRYSNNFQLCTFDANMFSYAYFYAALLLGAILLTALFYAKIYAYVRRSNLPRRLLLGQSTPMVVSSADYVSIFQRKSSPESHEFVNELRLARASFKIFIVFLLFWAPVTILIFMQAGNWVPEWLYLYSALAAHSNSAVNVFIYYFDNAVFRKAIRNVFSCSNRNQKRSLRIVLMHS